MDHVEASGRSRRHWLVALAIIVAAFIIAEIVAIVREGPDVSVVGRVAMVELHQLCLSSGESGPTCLHVDAPSKIVGISVGDCVTVLYSPEEILERVQEASSC